MRIGHVAVWADDLEELTTFYEALGGQRGQRYHNHSTGFSSPANVDQLAADCAARGIAILDGPRRTGDGYYECVISDPEGNRVELSA